MKKVIYGALSLMPAIAFAQTQFQPNGTLDQIVAFIGRTVTALIPIIFGLAIIYFFWGLVTFLRAAGDPKAKENGRNQMVWGVIAIAVMLSIYGLTNWLQGAFGITNNATIPVPTIQ